MPASAARSRSVAEKVFYKRKINNFRSNLVPLKVSSPYITENNLSHG